MGQVEEKRQQDGDDHEELEPLGGVRSYFGYTHTDDDMSQGNGQNHNRSHTNDNESSDVNWQFWEPFGIIVVFRHVDALGITEFIQANKKHQNM